MEGFKQGNLHGKQANETHEIRQMKLIFNYNRPANSHGLAMRLTDLAQISRSHEKTKYPNGKLVFQTVDI